MNFSFIDTPGFNDNRGISYEIANSFFRTMILEHVKRIKLLLLIEENDLYTRGDQFIKSINPFSNFLGIFDDENAKLIAKSIGIIITKVDNNNSTDEKILSSLKKKFLTILTNREKSKNINKISNFK